jgi:uncharacterized protein DUF4192
MSKRRQPVTRRASRRRTVPIPPTRFPDNRTSVRVTDPTDLLALVPYFLGFHPQESVVAVFIRSGRVLLTARVDLPAAAHLGAVVSQFDRLAIQHRAAELVLVAYSETEVELRSQFGEVVAGLTDSRVSEAIVVQQNRWWSLMCSATCCPPGGRPYEVESHRLAAEAVYAGMTVRGGRDELAALVVGPGSAELDRLAAMAASLRPVLEGLTRAQRAELVEKEVEAAVSGASLDEDRLLGLAVLTMDVLIRDLAWAQITRADAPRHVQLWVEVVAVAPPALASAPLALLGLAAWISGDGALQNCCVERLERSDPDYSLGTLLGEISARALPPTLWDELHAELRAELGSVTRSRELH